MGLNEGRTITGNQEEEQIWDATLHKEYLVLAQRTACIGEHSYYLYEIEGNLDLNRWM